MNLKTKDRITVESFPRNEIIDAGDLTPAAAAAVNEQWVQRGLGEIFYVEETPEGVNVVFDWEVYQPRRLIRCH